MPQTSRNSRGWPSALFVLLICLELGWSFCAMTRQQLKHNQTRREIPYIFWGRQFEGLDGIVKDLAYLGYLTDKDLDEQLPAMQFSQAQYTLAPVILDLNNPRRPLVLIDASSETAALDLIREHGLRPLKRNRFGIMLAEPLNP